MQRLATAEADFAARFAELLGQARETTENVAGPVAAIIADVRAHGDAALAALTRKFDPHDLKLRVTQQEVEAACGAIAPELMRALETAATRIEAFHRAQMPQDLRMTDAAGLTLGMRWGALEAVGVVRARRQGGVSVLRADERHPGARGGRFAHRDVRAGTRRRAEPAGAGGGAAGRRGRDLPRRGRAGGRGVCYGTATIAPVDRIVGPGNAFVAEAKRQVFGRVGIDSVAGPSEVVVLADAANDPAQVAMDLLAQAEHDEAAQAILVTDDAAFAERVERAVEVALQALPRAAIAGASWRAHGAIIVLRGWDEAPALVDRLAPEHLEIMTAQPEALFARIRHAGAAFLGAWCPEAIGDYVGGPNHVLPTGRTARFSSGLSVFDFLKRTTWIASGPEGLAAVGPAAVALAEAEGLDAHARSVALRLDAARARGA